MVRPGLIALVLLSTWLLAACGVKVRVQESSPELAAGLPPGVAVAVVGVGSSLATGRLLPADAADAADALYTSLLAGAPQLTVWSAPVTADALGAATVDSLLEDHGRLGALPAARVKRMQNRIPGVSYLVLARLEDDEVATDTATQGQTDPEARAEGQPEQESPLLLAMTTERRIQVALVFLDVASGETAWRGEAKASDRIRYEYDSPTIDPLALARDAQRSPELGDEPPIISRAGDTVRAPDLIELLGRAFRELVGDLPEPRK